MLTTRKDNKKIGKRCNLASKPFPAGRETTLRAACSQWKGGPEGVFGSAAGQSKDCISINLA